MVAWLETVLWGTTIDVVVHDPVLTVLEVTFHPPEALPDYPVERVRVSITAAGDVAAVPLGDPARTWHHIYPRPRVAEVVAAPSDKTWPLIWLLGGLCLEYPDDPPHLRWKWADGLAAYLRMVQRHLWSEEFYRREGRWPAEDAPHGAPLFGSTHPILTPDLRKPA